LLEESIGYILCDNLATFMVEVAPRFSAVICSIDLSLKLEWKQLKSGEKSLGLATVPYTVTAVLDTAVQEHDRGITTRKQ
jgi:hypothetical protein